MNKAGDIIINVSFLNFRTSGLGHLGGYIFTKAELLSETPKQFQLRETEFINNSCNQPRERRIPKEKVNFTPAADPVTDVIEFLNKLHKAYMESKENSEATKEYVQECYDRIDFEKLREVFG